MSTSPDHLLAQASHFHAAGNLAQAESLYRAAIAQDPARLDATAGLGILLSQTGNHPEALQLLPHDLVFRTNLPLLLVARGTSLLATQLPEDAIICLQRAVQLDPNSHEAHNTLGCALLAKKLYLESVTALRRAIQLHPNYPEAFFNLGLTLYAAGMYQESADIYLRAANLRPYPHAHLNRGFALRKLGNLDAAIGSFHQTLLLDPASDQAMHNLGATLADTGKVAEALQWLRRAIATNPKNHHAHSALLYLLNFDPNTTQDQLTTEQNLWQQHHAPQKPIQTSDFKLQTYPLRLGYVSPDFRAHAIARFLLPLLEHHNRQQFQIHLYASVRSPDATTRQFQNLADHWHDVLDLTDTQLAQKIRDDKIDILIDLTMHMEDNRLLTFAQQPAPTQISWLAYPGTTGLSAIQYHITDQHLDPPLVRRTGLPSSPSQDSRLKTHTSLHLPHSWSCYQPASNAPPLSPLPALTSNRLTFGSLNTFRKMNPQVLSLWADTLAAVGKAQPQHKPVHLILSCPEGSHRTDLLALFQSRGIPPTQIELLPNMPYADYLNTYQRIDIALDPFPHNGATTTLDALHMGVPVLALSPTATAHIPQLSQADSFHHSSFTIYHSTIPPARLAASILTTAGLTDWLATSSTDFIQKAVHFSQNLPHLSTLRTLLRNHLKTSPLTNAPLFTQHFEQALLSTRQNP